jgi:hypothetical protein
MMFCTFLCIEIVDHVKIIALFTQKFEIVIYIKLLMTISPL